MNLTFDHLYHGGTCMKANDQYIHYADLKMFELYDWNFVAFKSIPTVASFKKVETYFRNFQRQHHQSHLRFTFPDNQPIPFPLFDYLEDQGYTVGHVELYAIDPQAFDMNYKLVDITVKQVTDDTLDHYLTLHYWEDYSFGDTFTEQQQIEYKRRYLSSEVTQLIAYEGKDVVGSVDVILSEGTAEIDNLFVKNTHRRRGIGSILQKSVMKRFSERLIVLAADGEDTVREMYQKQHYQYQGYRYEALYV